MTMYDVFVKDPDEYGGGFEVRIPAADSPAEAIAEAVAAGNAELEPGEPRYDADDCTVSEVAV